MSVSGRRSTSKAMRLAYTSPEGYHGPDSPRRASERERLGQEVEQTLDPAEPRPRTCSVSGCSERHCARDRCRRHYVKWLRYQEHLTGPRLTPQEQARARPEIVAECLAAYAALAKVVGGE